MTQAIQDLLSFEEISLRGSEMHGKTSCICKIKSVLGEDVMEMDVHLLRRRSDKKLSELEREILTAIHTATNPSRRQS